MPRAHYVIYVPGLDDSRKGYELLVNRWSIYGIVPNVHRVGWYDEEKSFEPKLKELVSEIDSLIKKGNTVSLVGGSAGGSAVLNAFIEQPKINAVVDLCGRLRAGKNVTPSLDWAARNSPAFKESVLLFEKREPGMKKEQRQRVLTLSPIWDEIVPKTTVPLQGATNKTLPSIEHILSGFLGLTVFSPIVIGFVKEKAKLVNA